MPGRPRADLDRRDAVRDDEAGLGRTVVHDIRDVQSRQRVAHGLASVGDQPRRGRQSDRLGQPAPVAGLNERFDDLLCLLDRHPTPLDRTQATDE